MKQINSNMNQGLRLENGFSFWFPNISTTTITFPVLIKRNFSAVHLDTQYLLPKWITFHINSSSDTPGSKLPFLLQVYASYVTNSCQPKTQQKHCCWMWSVCLCTVADQGPQFIFQLRKDSDVRPRRENAQSNIKSVNHRTWPIVITGVCPGQVNKLLRTIFLSVRKNVSLLNWNLYKSDVNSSVAPGGPPFCRF